MYVNRLQILHTPTVLKYISVYLNDIQSLAEDFTLISQNEFDDWVDLWKKVFIRTTLSPDLFCYEFLLKIDDVLGDQSTCKDMLLEKGPFNYGDEYSLYLKPPKSFFFNYFEKGKIIHRRQTVEYDTDTLNIDFCNFEIVKSTQLHDYIPKILEYKSDCMEIKNLKFACIPLSNEPWFTTRMNKQTKDLLIEYDPCLMLNHNQKIKDLLLECENQQVNVAVFPELAMTPTTKDDIQRFLISKNFKHLKLCFLGSTWGNNVNEACLITGKGTILILEKKKSPYNKYIKEDACYYTELIRHDHIINFIDIPYIGRIVYLICADFNNDSINTVCSVMHSNFVFVSALTNSTDLMVKTAQSLASRRGVSTVICNSCVNLDSEKPNNYIAYSVIPKVQDRMILLNEVCRCSSCPNDYNCKLCLKTYTISRTYP